MALGSHFPYWYIVTIYMSACAGQVAMPAPTITPDPSSTQPRCAKQRAMARWTRSPPCKWAARTRAARNLKARTLIPRSIQVFCSAREQPRRRQECMGDHRRVSGFQWPYCGQFLRLVKSVLLKQCVETGKVTFVYKQMAILGRVYLGGGSRQVLGISRSSVQPAGRRKPGRIHQRQVAGHGAGTQARHDQIRTVREE
jgi:hypothetical protein